MRVEDIREDGDRVTATVYLQASRVPKTSDPVKRAASYERSVIKAFEYRGWRVIVDALVPDPNDAGKLSVSVVRENSERDDSLRECRRWSNKTRAVREIVKLAACAPLLLTFTPLLTYTA